MRIPARDSSYLRAVHFGLYAARRLSRKKQDDLAGPVRDSSRELLALGRALEEAGIAVQDGYADRDAVGDDLDIVAQEIRQELGSRGLGAGSRPPYTDIFPDGFDYYLEAPVGEQVQRYNLLVQRIEANLPPDDAVRTGKLPTLKALLEEYVPAESALQTLQNEAALAKDRLTSARASWEKRMIDTHATLVQRLDKKQAELFFPRPAKRRAAESAGPDTA